MQRRQFTQLLACSLPPALPYLAGLSIPNFSQAKDLAKDNGRTPTSTWRALQQIERDGRCRLGVRIVDTGGTTAHSYRPDERFLMCSVVKLLISAAVLRRVDRGEESLQRRIVYDRSVLLQHSPTTEKHVGGNGLALAELCEAAMIHSDNAAANLLLDTFGGPPQVTALARELGDPVTRLDDVEPMLNRQRPGDPANTTSPRAMVGLMHKLLLGDALTPESRARLLSWMQANTTGDNLVRAAFKSTAWPVGDKTGGGERTRNDVAIISPPGRAPWLATVFVTDSRGSASSRDETIAKVGRLLHRLM